MDKNDVVRGWIPIEDNPKADSAGKVASLVGNQKLVKNIALYIQGSVDDVEDGDAHAIAKAVIKMVEDEMQSQNQDVS